ncbi:MAG TPA: hypothetical protein VK971_00495 [Thiohalobacter sp.]|nr:hypothetical protein [Thiohalobacter sp.]
MKDATAQIEDFLRAERAWNQEHNCLPSETAVIDRLLASRESLTRVYARLSSMSAWTWQSRLRRIICVAAVWRPESGREQREAMHRIREEDAEIARKHAELARLIGKRDAVADQAGVVVAAAPDIGVLERMDPHPGDRLSAAATKSRKASINDTVRALMTDTMPSSPLPQGLADRRSILEGMTDAEIADLVNVALALPEEDLRNADNIKTLRHR